LRDKKGEDRGTEMAVELLLEELCPEWLSFRYVSQVTL
jgi:hypothetical protein